MKENNLVLDKSKKFAIRIINLYKYLSVEKKSLFCQNKFLKAEQVSVQM